MSHKNDLKIINEAIDEIKDSDVISDLFKKYKVDIDEIYLIPIRFDDDLDVSGRTAHGVISLNGNLRNSLDDVKHYLAHEITHFCQQTTGTKPTTSEENEHYLDNKEEQEGFQNQTEFIAEEEGEDAAEEYVDQVLDHHQINDEKEREERKDDLLAIAGLSEELRFEDIF